MEEQKTNRSSRWNRINWNLIIMSILIIAIFVVGYTRYIKKDDVMYCHFEAERDDANIPRSECFNMKIISDDLYDINLTQFNKLNFTSFSCDKRLETLPLCNESNKYFSYYPLYLFCDDCGVDGFIGVEYYIEYYTDDKNLIQEFEKSFMMEKYNSSIDVHKRLRNFNGR